MGHGLVQRHVLRHGLFGRAEQGGHKVPGVGQAGGDTLGRVQRGAAAGHQLFGAQGGQCVQRGWPFFKLGVAGVAGGIGLDQVAREQHLFAGHPDDGVALGVAGADVHDFHFELAHPQRHAVFEHQGGPGQTGDGVERVEQAGKALVLGLHVLRAALHDELVGALAGNDFLHARSLVARRAQHTHRVVVRQHHVLDGFVGDLADFGNEALRHDGRGQRVANEHAVFANDHAGVGVTLGGVGPAVFGQLGKGGLFDSEVGDGGKLLGHDKSLETKRAVLGLDGTNPNTEWARF